MRPLRNSINVTVDGCCDHRAIPLAEDVHRSAAEDLAQADALLCGRVIYEMMEAAWRPPAAPGARPDWMEPFAEAINAAKKYVVSGTLEQVDWNAELVRGELVRQPDFVIVMSGWPVGGGSGWCGHGVGVGVCGSTSAAGVAGRASAG